METQQNEAISQQCVMSWTWTNDYGAAQAWIKTEQAETSSIIEMDK